MGWSECLIWLRSINRACFRRSQMVLTVFFCKSISLHQIMHQKHDTNRAQISLHSTKIILKKLTTFYTFLIEQEWIGNITLKNLLQPKNLSIQLYWALLRVFNTAYNSSHWILELWGLYIYICCRSMIMFWHLGQAVMKCTMSSLALLAERELWVWLIPPVVHICQSEELP